MGFLAEFPLFTPIGCPVIPNQTTGLKLLHSQLHGFYATHRTWQSCFSGCCQDPSWAFHYLEAPGSNAIPVLLHVDKLQVVGLRVNPTKCHLDGSCTFHPHLTFPILHNKKVPHSTGSSPTDFRKARWKPSCLLHLLVPKHLWVSDSSRGLHRKSEFNKICGLTTKSGFN